MRFPVSESPRNWLTNAIALAVFAVCLATSTQGQDAIAKAVGTVKSVNGNTVVLTTDAGAEVTVSFGDAARIRQMAPGQTDLKTASPIAVSDIQAGDRVLARGSGDAAAVVATSAIVMRKTDIAERQQREREEWRKGVGGIVKSVDAAASTVTIANSLAAGGKPIVIHVAPETAIRRYSPDSVKFDDARPGTLDQIKAGDQLRARGTKNDEGTEFSAHAIVSGTFRDIAGTVVSTDAAANSVTVTDLATKKPVVVKVSSDSQLRKLLPMMAMGMAMRLKGSTPGGFPGGAPGQPGPSGGGGMGSGSQPPGAGNSQGSSAPGGMPGGNWRGGGGPDGGDFQQMLTRTPAVTIADLHKGDAVILVATEGSSSSGPTLITLLAGVEPILTAAPAGSAATSILSPWNLGTGAAGGGDAASQ